MLIPLPSPQFVYQVFHLLRSRLGADQNRITGVHYNYVPEANGGEALRPEGKQSA